MSSLIMLWKTEMCPSPLETQINCFSLIYSFAVTAILIGWSVVINFIEHISMAHPLCHALFTQLELGIKRYTYWAGGQKYFYRPDLVASPCRTWEPCVHRLQWDCDWLRHVGLSELQHCITVSEKKSECLAGGCCMPPHELRQGRMDGTTVAAPLTSVPLQTHLQLLIWYLGAKTPGTVPGYLVRNTLTVITEFNLPWCAGKGSRQPGLGSIHPRGAAKAWFGTSTDRNTTHVKRIQTWEQSRFFTELSFLLVRVIFLA